jgi:hypothetical protein
MGYLLGRWTAGVNTSTVSRASRYYPSITLAPAAGRAKWNQQPHKTSRHIQNANFILHFCAEHACCGLASLVFDASIPLIKTFRNNEAVIFKCMKWHEFRCKLMKDLSYFLFMRSTYAPWQIFALVKEFVPSLGIAPLSED